MLTIQEKNTSREEMRTVYADRREVAGVGTVHYFLKEEDGASRAAYGTPCARFYTMVICTDEGECRLPDIARERTEAIALCRRMADAAVLPVNAEEIFEELCLS